MNKVFEWPSSLHSAWWVRTSTRSGRVAWLDRSGGLLISEECVSHHVKLTVIIVFSPKHENHAVMKVVIMLLFSLNYVPPSWLNGTWTPITVLLYPTIHHVIQPFAPPDLAFLFLIVTCCPKHSTLSNSWTVLCVYARDQIFRCKHQSTASLSYWSSASESEWWFTEESCPCDWCHPISFSFPATAPE